jgi:hypothetical protein
LKTARDFKLQFEEYLFTLEAPKVKSLAELIEFNQKNADKELPKGKNSFTFKLAVS